MGVVSSGKVTASCGCVDRRQFSLIVDYPCRVMMPKWSGFTYGCVQYSSALEDFYGAMIQGKINSIA